LLGCGGIDLWEGIRSGVQFPDISLKGACPLNSMGDCAICQECAGFKGKPCLDSGRARPAFHSVGIDVFATVKQFDLPLSTLKSEDEEQNWYSAVFVA